MIYLYQNNLIQIKLNFKIPYNYRTKYLLLYCDN